MNIVICLDSNLIKQAVILIKSIIATNASEEIHFFALLLNVGKGDVLVLKNAVAGNAILSVYELSDELENLPIPDNRITVGTYLRFLIEKKTSN